MIRREDEFIFEAGLITRNTLLKAVNDIGIKAHSQSIKANSTGIVACVVSQCAHVSTAQLNQLAEVLQAYDVKIRGYSNSKMRIEITPGKSFFAKEGSQP